MSDLSILITYLLRFLWHWMAAASRRNPNLKHGTQVLFFRDGAEGLEVLLVKQTYTADSWRCLGGGLEAGETPADGARREASEEANLTNSLYWLYTTRPVVSADTRNAARSSGGRKRVLYYYACYLGQERPALTLQASEIAQAEWHPVNRLPPVTPLMSHAIRYATFPLTGPRFWRAILEFFAGDVKDTN